MFGMYRKKITGSFLLVSVFLYSANGCAGPPLIVDDAGILKPGQWETILAADAVKTDAIKTFDAPVLDVSYGLTDNTQMSVFLSRQHVEEHGKSRRSNFGYGEIGWKWRFYQNDSVGVAFGPAYSVPLSSDSTIRGIIDEIRVLAKSLCVFYYQ